MKVVLTAFLVTLSIELVQIFISGRVFDIDDIILNTLGGAIGYSLYCFARALLLKKKPGRAEMLASIASLAVVPLFIGTVLLVRGEFVYLFTQPVPLPGKIECASTADEPEEALIWKKADYDEKLLESRLFAAGGERRGADKHRRGLPFGKGAFGKRH